MAHILGVQTVRKTDRWIDRESERCTNGRWTDRQIDGRPIDGQRDKCGDRHMDGKPDEQTGRDGQTNKRTKRQTEGDKYLQTERK